MTVDRIHDTKSAVSDFTDRVADDASPNTAAAVSDDPANAPQIGLSSALGGDDSAGLPSLHAGLSRPVTISFDPPAANSALTGPAVTAPLAAATVTEEFFTGNFSAAPPSVGAGGLVDFDCGVMAGAERARAARRLAAAAGRCPGARRTRPA